MSRRNPKLSDDVLAKALEAKESGTSVSQLARDLGVARASIRDALLAFERRMTAAAEPGVETHDDGSLTVTSELMDEVAAGTMTDEKMLRHFGHDIDDYLIPRRRVGTWGSVSNPSFQYRLDMVPKSSLILPLTGTEVYPPAPKAAFSDDGDGQRVMLLSDPHAPFHDRGLWGCALEMIRDYKPERIVFTGDGPNWHSISEHSQNEQWRRDTVQLGIDAFGQMLAEARDAAGDDCQIDYIEGNHDARIHRYARKRAENLLGIKPYGSDVPALSLRGLLPIDRFGINLVENYPHGKVFLNKNLAIEHGDQTSNSTGENALNKLARSVGQGHSHRFRMTYRTEHDTPDGALFRTRVAFEGGCLCQLHEGLDHAKDANWHQGLMFGTVWEDGDFAVAPAIYAPGRLLLPDGKRYRATVGPDGEAL